MRKKKKKKKGEGVEKEGKDDDARVGKKKMMK